MTDEKEKKFNKSVFKTTKETVAIIMAVVLIGVYIFYECYAVNHVEVETVTAVTSTVYESLETQAIVVRDEHIINYSGGAVTVPCVSDGEKVKLGGNIAMEFSSAEDAEEYANLTDLQSKLNYYLDLESKSAGVATDVEAIDKDIIDDVNLYIRSTADYNSENLTYASNELNDKLTRRQMIIGESIDFSKVTGGFQSKINSIDSNACAPTGYVKTDKSGIFSSYTDGCEELFDYDNIENINIKTFDNYVNQIKSAKKTSCIGKLINDYDWYFCCKATADEVKDIQNGDKLMVDIKNGGDVLECEVVSGASIDLGTEETVLVLRSSHMNGAITSMRLEDIEIRFKEYAGFKVPSNAVHIDAQGNKGVYALVANQVFFRQGEMIYSTKDYAVFKYDTESDESIRLYDQIITKGKDLHHGKVYS